MSARPFVAFEHEAWLGNRLDLAGLFDGATDHEIRRERIRKAILERGPDKVCGRNKASVEVTYREAFEKLYGVAL